jgi:hypothetical protein
LYDFLLFAHVLSAFALGAMTVMYSSFALGGPAPTRAVSTAQVLDGVGGAGTLIFGVWLALYIDGYEITDGWIIAAILLWAAAAETGRRAHAALTAGGVGVATPVMVRWHVIRAALVVVLLADMVFKPGA